MELYFIYQAIFNFFFDGPPLTGEVGGETW